MPALCPRCERVVWGARPRCQSCELLLLPRDAEQLLAELDTPDRLEAQIDRALLLHELHNHSQAARELRDIVARWPASGRAHLALGLALARGEEPELLTAMRCVSRAVRLDPARLSPPRSPAEVMATRAAREHLDELETRGPCPEIGLELGQFRAMTGDYSGALDAYTDGLNASPNDPELLTAIGVALRVLGKAREAVELHQQAIEARPDFALAYNNLTSAYADLGDVEAARASAARALELRHDLGHAYVSLGFVLLDAGDTDAAFAALEIADRSTPSLRPHVASLLAMGALQRGEAEEALAEADDGLGHRVSHRVPQLHLVRAAALEALGEPESAADALEPLWSMATLPVLETPAVLESH